MVICSEKHSKKFNIFYKNIRLGIDICNCLYYNIGIRGELWWKVHRKGEKINACRAV